MSKSVPVLILICLLSNGIMSQSLFQPGYVVTAPGDTVAGSLDNTGEILLAESCRFRPDGEAAVIEYLPGEISGFRFRQARCYRTRIVDGTPVFLEIFVEGEVNLYFRRTRTGEEYYIENLKEGLNRIPYEEGKREKDGRDYFYHSTLHYGLLNIYMNEAHGIEEQTAAIEKPDRKNLIRLAEYYHTAIDRPCRLFEEKRLLPRMNVELTGGMVRYDDVDVATANNFHGGALVHLHIRRGKDRFFIRSGMLFSYLEIADSKGPYYTFPLQVEYIYPKGLIRPKAAYGINIYSPFYQSVSMMAGLNIRLKENIFLSLNYDVDFGPSNFPLFPDDFYSQAVMTGVYVVIP